ncbi:MAG TPA: methyltransferase, partial [Treponemataceae bacterium]|nr:methyltransferase [Treponemataceae bacterium]
ATHHFLTKVRGIPARVTGLDLKKDVIDHCQALVQRYGSSGLRFLTGDIEHYSCDTPPDVVISLHACDTATDAALAKAVSWGSKAILAVPCCQHELNARLAEKDTSSPAEQELAYALKHGLVRERIAALLTDASRAAVLEQYGYRVQLLEFIDMSHTPKNILIRAIKKTQTHSIPTRACRPFGRELSLERLLGGDKE